MASGLREGQTTPPRIRAHASSNHKPRDVFPLCFGIASQEQTHSFHVRTSDWLPASAPFWGTKDRFARMNPPDSAFCCAQMPAAGRIFRRDDSDAYSAPLYDHSRRRTWVQHLWREWIVESWRPIAPASARPEPEQWDNSPPDPGLAWSCNRSDQLFRITVLTGSCAFPTHRHSTSVFHYRTGND